MPIDIPVQAPASLKKNARDLALISFRIDQTLYSNKSAEDALKILKTYTNSLNIRVTSAMQWHADLIDIRKDSHGLVAISDHIAGAQIPPISIWNPLLGQIRTMQQQLGRTENIESLIIMAAYSSRLYERCYYILSTYAARNQRGYDIAIKSLTVIKKTAELTIGAYNPYVGGLYTASLDLVTQEEEVRYNMRDKIDGWGILTNLAIDEIFSFISNRLADKIIELIKLPSIQQSLPFTLKDKLLNRLRLAPNTIKELLVKAVANKMGVLISKTLENAIKSYRDKPTKDTWEVVNESVVEQISKKEMSLDVVKEILTNVIELYK